MNDTSRRVDTAVKQAVRQRNYRRVRDRALARLANLYPDQYRELFEEERARDEKENKVWIDISGRTRAGMGAPTRSRSRQTAKRRGYRKQKSKLGRKR
jgi:hypothetical protein